MPKFIYKYLLKRLFVLDEFRWLKLYK
jgi:hypothetical protein